MNDYFRKILITRINKAIADSRDAHHLEHPALTGKLREIVLHQLIEPMLNERYSIGYGKVIDHKGSLSKEVDLCVYSKMLHPPLFFSGKKEIGMFPVESVLACLEVKSTLNKSTLRDAVEKFKFLDNNLTMTSGYHDQYENPMTHRYIKPKYHVFGFNNDAKKYTAESLLSLYAAIDPAWNTDPLVSSICLVNKGWICFTIKGWLHMPFSKKTKVNEELIAFLCTLVQDLSRTEESRGMPRIGYYLTDPSTTGRFKNGRLVKRPWNRKGPLEFSESRIEKVSESKLTGTIEFVKLERR